MTGFIAFALVAVAASIAIALPLVAGRRPARGQDRVDAQVFRDQLAEVDRDLARGTISPDEAEGARLEISRRLLRADRQSAQAGDLAPAPSGLSMGIAVAVIVAVPAMSAALYMGLGTPGLPDQPLSSRSQPTQDRPTQAEAEEMMAGQLVEIPVDPEAQALLARLQQVLAQRPEDAEGQRLLGNSLLSVGRFVEARAAFERHLELVATPTPDTYANYAEAMILAAGGYVSPAAEQAIANALRQNPDLPMARYYAGIALRQAGRPDQALQIWQRLRAEAPAGAPWLGPLDQTIAETMGTDAPARPGPTQDQMDAAQDMTAEERQEMITGMVAGLEDRLTGQGGEVEEWVGLMQSYMVLNRPDDALRIYQLAIAAQGEASARSFVKEQALLMGLDVE